MVGRAVGLNRIGRGAKDWQVLSNTKLESGLEIQMIKVSPFLTFGHLGFDDLRTHFAKYKAIRTQ